MINPDNFLVLFHFTNPEHKKFFFDQIKKLSSALCVFKPGILIVRSQLKMSAIYENCKQDLEKDEYIFIFPVDLHFLPQDAALKAFLLGVRDSC